MFDEGMDRNDVCGLLFGPKCGPITAKMHLWNVTLPRKLHQKTTAKQVSVLQIIQSRTGGLFLSVDLYSNTCLIEFVFRFSWFQKSGNTLNVLHLSDFHYDPQYREGAEVECHKPLCCRTMPNPRRGDTRVPKVAGRFGDINNCDMPLETLESLVEDAASSAKTVCL